MSNFSAPTRKKGSNSGLEKNGLEMKNETI